MKKDIREVSQLIHLLRKKGFTRKEIRNLTGIPERTQRRYENRPFEIKTNPSKKTIQRIKPIKEKRKQISYKRKKETIAKELQTGKRETINKQGTKQFKYIRLAYFPSYKEFKEKVNEMGSRFVYVVLVYADTKALILGLEEEFLYYRTPAYDVTEEANIKELYLEAKELRKKVLREYNPPAFVFFDITGVTIL